MSLFFTEEKLRKQIGELASMRYRDGIDIEKFIFQKDERGENGVYPPVKGENTTMIDLGESWVGRDVYCWLSASVDIPAEWSGKRILGRFDFGITGGGNNSGFESLLFVNGHTYQGVDSNHGEVFFPEDAAGTTLSLQFRLWSGLGGYESAKLQEHRLQKAELCWLDEATDDYYYTARSVLETVEMLDEARSERHDLLSALNRSSRYLDWSKPGSQAFYLSVEEACRCLREQLQAMPKASSVVVQCIGHTHIDVAWLWRLQHTREKAARSFSTVLRLMELYPEYVFLQTQPQLYAYIKQDYPEIYGQIRAKIREGRWEAGGAMWLEADCNLPSGESLVRQILYGTQFLREEFGVECRYLWLPDVFGYSWALPQILRKSGIEVFMTTKISWNQYNRMPHDTFQWKGIDGSEVLTHFITTPDPGGGEGSFYYTYNGGITPHSTQGIWEGYRDKQVNKKLLLAYGYGDGGGGVNREMLEMRRRLAELPGLPQVTTGRADHYFDELLQTVSNTDEYVHTWDGELYLELHRGTYTSQAYNKRMNRKLELLYREAEWLYVLSALCGRNAASPVSMGTDWAEGWAIILRNQFHDIIPGSSIREVYDDSWEEYRAAEQIGNKVSRQAFDNLVMAAENTVTIVNSAPWERNEPVYVTKPHNGIASGIWRTPEGEVCLSQQTEGGWLVHAQVPSMGMASILFEAKTSVVESTPFIYQEWNLETPHYKLQWNKSGQLTSIFDKGSSREMLADGEIGNELQVFEDKPKSRHEAWDIDIFYQDKQRSITGCSGITLAENGPIRASIRFQWSYMDSTIVQDMVVYADSRRIDFVTKVDWHEQRQLLKAAFPVSIRSTEATYDIQFGNVKRPTHWNTSWDAARFETVGHQWADLSERDYGVSLLNDCKYGYDIKGHVLRLSLIKSAMVPDREADQGEHMFTYSLFPHQGDWHSGGTVREAWALNQPLSICSGVSASGHTSLFDFSLSHVMVDAVKPAENGDGFILRIHEYAGARGQLTIHCSLPIREWLETDLLERPISDGTGKGDIQSNIKPYEIKTFLIRF